jgi:ribulose 1,5-bisphosphate carboxylase large subunit-like protein
VGCLEDTIRKVLVNGLATRFCVKPKVASKFLPVNVEQWGKLRRLEGGDIMHAHDIVSKRVDGRDASFVRVRELLYYQISFKTNLSPSFPR